MARKKKEPAKDGNGKTAEEAAAAPEQPLGEDAQFGILAQFIKDLSFESPNAPLSLQTPGENPKLEVNVQVQGFKHADEVFEVDLLLEAKASSDLGVIYNIELVYGGMFRAVNIPDQYIIPVLYVDAPTILFPFLRRVAADLTRDGGFQPLMLDPVDFAGLYQQNADKAKLLEAQPKS